MPRTVSLVISFILFIFIISTQSVQASVFEYVNMEMIQQGRELILPEDNILLQLPPNSLSGPTRISLWTDLSPDTNKKIYHWQILDAEIIVPIKLKLPRPIEENIYLAPQVSVNGVDWQLAQYEYLDNYAELVITQISGEVQFLEITQELDITLDALTVQKGYPVATTDKFFNFYILPQAFTQAATIHIKPLPVVDFPVPLGKKLVSPIYYFYIDAATGEFPKLDLPIDIKYFVNNTNAKDIYYWDNVNKIWLPSPSLTRVNEKVVRTLTHQREMILAVLESDIMEQGTASWYRYKNGDFAASPDYAKGTKLKVTNIDNGKSVVVVVNDYGPDRLIHPERVIDLDRVAFQKIANPSLGVIEVVVEENYY